MTPAKREGDYKRGDREKLETSNRERPSTRCVGPVCNPVSCRNRHGHKDPDFGVAGTSFIICDPPRCSHCRNNLIFVLVSEREHNPPHQKSLVKWVG